MKTEIPQFLQNEFKKYRSYTSKFPEEIKRFIFDYAVHYNWDIKDNLLVGFRMIKNNLSDIPDCAMENCYKKVKIIPLTGEFTSGCCSKHSSIATSLKKFGTMYPNESKIVKEKKKNTCLKKYNVPYVIQSKETQDKIKKANLRKHGTEYYNYHSEVVQEKIKMKIFKKYKIHTLNNNTIDEMISKNEIPLFLKDEFKKKIPQYKLFPNEIIQFLNAYSIFYNFGVSNTKTIFKMMKNGLSQIPSCEIKNCNKQKAVIKKSGTLQRGCCTKHSIMVTLLEKYDVDHYSKTEEFKEKIVSTNLEKFGGNAPACSKNVIEKMKETMFERYGVTNPMKNETIRKRAQETIITKFGVSNISQSNIIKDKKKATLKKNYGVEHQSHIPEVAEKILKNRFKIKQYKWKTGEISHVQGYEPIVLKELEENGYTYDQVITGASNIPKISYFFEDKDHIYYPDIFIPEENLIIEVKSTYTLDLEWDKNQAKFEATKDAGFKFRLEVR